MTDQGAVSSMTVFDEDSNDSVKSLRSTSTDTTGLDGETESTCTTKDDGNDESL